MDNCINKFLVNYNQGNIEKHSDSSDFDETQVAPRVSAKSGKHSLLDKELETIIKVKKKVSGITCKTCANKLYMHRNLNIDDNIPEHDHDVANQKRKSTHKEESGILRNRGDDLTGEQAINNSKNTQLKPIQCFSNILKKTNNCTKQISSTKDIPRDNLNNGKTFCPDCERRRIKKLNRRRQSYVVQPVYAVDNIQGGPVPFGHANDPAPLSQHIHKMRKQDSVTSYELTSSESEIGNKNQRKHGCHRRNFIDRFQKEMRKEYVKYEKELIRNRMQQYPSKRDYNLPYQVFSTPYCQIMNGSPVQENEHSNIPSTSSGFWEYLFEKIRGKRHADKNDSIKPCYCPEDGRGLPGPSPPQQTDRCSPENCAHYEGAQGEILYDKLKDYVPECQSCTQQTEDPQNESSTKSPPRKSVTQNGKSGAQSRKSGMQNVQCKCYSNKKRKQPDNAKNSQKSLTRSEDVCRPCQEPHDDITRTVEDKYNGEILCIHNPPCILINGCLNLPGTERPLVQGNLWPVTQEKKSSFYHICRKMRRPKNNCEQACQYHPPSIEVQRAMQIKAEKLVQSICNHDPPCEVVYGCYKAKYDPKLDNSCVHVPMCQRLPECLIEDRQERTKKQAKLCEHKPKCTEVPLCSRKLVVLTAKGTVGTQVRPKTKLVCRHEPPCIMIPKCLARIISDSYIPYEAIPDCVHQPCCDMIPACCRKAAKEMAKLSSVEDGITLKLPRAPVSHKNRILRAIRRTQK